MGWVDYQDPNSISQQARIQGAANTAIKAAKSIVMDQNGPMASSTTTKSPAVSRLGRTREADGFERGSMRTA